MEAKASARYLRGSAQKARLVVDMIRGKNVNQALAVLQFTNKRAADGIEACMRSAIANATEAAEKANVAVDPDDLWVKEAFVDMGPTKNRRRMRPAPQGRAYREQRHYCHVTVLLSSDDMPATRSSRKNAKVATAGSDKATPKRATQPTTKVRDSRRQSEDVATEETISTASANEETVNTTAAATATAEENVAGRAVDETNVAEKNAGGETSAEGGETKETAKE